MPGISPLFPDVHCTLDGEICQVVTGEGGKKLGSRSVKNVFHESN